MGGGGGLLELVFGGGRGAVEGLIILSVFEGFKIAFDALLSQLFMSKLRATSASFSSSSSSSSADSLSLLFGFGDGAKKKKIC